LGGNGELFQGKRNSHKVKTILEVKP